MKRANEKRVTIAFWLVLTVLAVVRLVFYSVTTGYIDNSRRVERSRQVLQELHTTFSAIQDVETGQRGFVITGDEQFLKPYNDATNSVPQRLASLRALVADDPEQLTLYAEAERLANAKMGEVTEVITRYRKGGFPTAQDRVREGTGRRLMDQLRAVIAQMDAAENTRLNNFATATATD